MKIIYFTDSHFRLNVPVRRKEKQEDFQNKILLKLKRVLETAKDKNADCIICGGDFFDNATPSYSLYNKIADILEKNKIILYVVPGNHDIFNANINTLYRTALMGLEQSKLIKLLLNPIDNDEVCLFPIPYMMTIPNFNIKSQSKTKILIPHIMLVDEPANYDHILIDDIDTNADIVLCSHYHKAFDKTINKTRFINPGSLVRLSSLDHNYNRVPKIIFIDINEDIIEYIEFDEFGKGKEIFDKIEHKEEDINFENFLSFVNEFKNSENLNIEKAIKEVSDKYDVPDKVVLEAKKRLI